MLLSLLQYIVCFLLMPVEDINLDFIVRCIFHSPGFLRSSIMSCNCGLTLSSYSFIDDFLSFSLLYSEFGL